MTQPRRQRRFSCFISYKHGVDSELAKAVHLALHRLAKPWWKLRALHLFRDETVLTASPDLGLKIRQALADSEYLLLIASPDAVRSTWVEKELRQWLLDDKHARRVLIALSAGELVWDPAGGTFDGELSTALPAVLLDVLEAEPLWVDLRHCDAPDRRRMDHQDFRQGMLKIGGRLHGKAPEELEGDELRARSTVRRLLAAGLFAAVALGLFAFAQRESAVRQRGRSEAGEQAVLAQLAADRDPHEAPAYIVRALEHLESVGAAIEPHVELAIRETHHLVRDDVRWSTGEVTMRGLALVAGRLVLAGGDLLRQRDPATGIDLTLPLAATDGLPLGTLQMTIGHNDSSVNLLARGFSGESLWRRVDIASGDQEFWSLEGLSHPVGLGVLADGSVVIADRGGELRHMDETGRILSEWKLDAGGRVACSASVNLCAVADRAPVFGDEASRPSDSLQRNARVLLLDPNVGVVGETESPHTAVTQLRFKGRTLWSLGSEGLAQEYEVANDQVIREDAPITAHREPATAMSTSGKRLAVGARSGLIRVWMGGTEVAYELRGHIAAIRGLAFDEEDSCRLWSLSNDGQVRGWNLCRPVGSGESLESWEGQSPDGGWLARTVSSDILLRSPNGDSYRRAIPCVAERQRLVDLLAVSNEGIALATCLGGSVAHDAVIVSGGGSSSTVTLPEDEYHAAWSLSDGSFLTTVGSIFTTLPDFAMPNPLPDGMRSARLVRYGQSAEAMWSLDLRPLGMIVTLVERVGQRDVLAGTSTGRLLRIEIETGEVLEDFALARLVKPNRESPLSAVKQVSCCLGEPERIVAAVGAVGFPSALGGEFRDEIVVFDLEERKVSASLKGERRSALGVGVLPEERRVVVVYGAIDPLADGSSVFRFFDDQLRPTSPIYPLASEVLTPLAVDRQTKRLSAMLLGEGRVWIDTDLDSPIIDLELLQNEKAVGTQVDELLVQVDESEQGEDWATAEAHCSAVLEIQTKHRSCLIRRGNFRSRQGRPEEALTDYEEARRIDEFDPILPSNTARTLMALDRLAEAEAEATVAIERAHLVVRPTVLEMGTDHPLFAINLSMVQSMAQLMFRAQGEAYLLRARIRLTGARVDAAETDLNRALALGASGNESDVLADWLEDLRASVPRRLSDIESMGDGS